MNFKKFHYYFYTIKDLKFSQILYRLKYLCGEKFSHIFKNRLNNKINAELNSIGDKIYSNSNFIKMRRKYYNGNVDILLNNEFTFLNITKSFGTEISWNYEINSDVRLWYFNLHYHEFFIDIAEAFLKTKDEKYLNFLCNGINDWIENNQLNDENASYVAWNSYVVSIRVVAWIKIYCLLEKYLPEKFAKIMINSLKIQSLKLYHTLELDILGNHLIKNWKALAFSGKLFDNKKLLYRARDLYRCHVREQFVESGVHEELTPMYSGIILEDLLEIYALAQTLVEKEKISKLYSSVGNMVFSNKYYSFFNDSVNNNGVQFANLKQVFQTLINDCNDNSNLKNYSGMCIYKNNDYHIIMDAAPIGLGLQFGHGHCDMLSFELNYKGHKIFTNSGTYEYIYTKRRKYIKSAASHNTLKPITSDQAEVWNSFRIARKSKVKLLNFKKMSKGFNFLAEVNGFYPKRGCHRRMIELKGEEIQLEDYWTGTEKAEVFFHLAPPFNFINCHNKDISIIDKNNVEVGTFKSSATDINIIVTEYYPELGVIEKKSTLVIRNIMPNSTVKSTISLF